ncbi:hypothetical protein Belba_0487 [Belliella baltica DSM 15883]|uniref:Uncharacterized protein n=1 Tax=Belliella baltica (strain DSM 15883 / CIP 108006 / LMG 21964 / BA134) TaxID=866536 RepID=I3Z1M7_BELBD|nr:hypothetical protein [Belliella baltica]AFL83145.1 hypothetical protein Belba_0487 [Belliella baltica DSM 15883]
MAKQTGSLTLEGTMGNVIFYKRNGKFYSRSKGSPKKKRLKEGPEFENSRRVSSEFGHASKFAAKLSRSCVGLLNPGRHDGLHGRLTSKMHKVVQSDPVSVYGCRRLRFGDLDLMKGFDFEATSLKSLIANMPTVDHQGQVVRINFSRIGGVKKKAIPGGATHYRVDLLWCRLHEVNEKVGYQEYQENILDLDDSLDLNGIKEMDLGSALQEEEVLFLVMGIVFLQEVNGKMNELAGKRAVGVLEVLKR